MQKITIIVVVLILLVGCGDSPTESLVATQSEPKATMTMEPELTDAPIPTEVTQVTEAPTAEPLPPEPQRIEFNASDGTNLVGMYYPAKVNPAPIVVLMHWALGDKSDWEMIGMTSWLTNRAEKQGGGLFSRSLGTLPPYQFPEMPDRLSFGVFTFDFRGGGESGPESLKDPSGWVMDAVAAYEKAQNLPGVDPDKVVGIGASIGSDGVVDGCGDICLAALSISPGSYLKLSYEMTVKNLTDEMKRTWCIAADDDPTSALECRAVEGFSERVVIYPQGGHGMMLFDPKLNLDPNLGQVIQEFIFEAFEIAP